MSSIKKRLSVGWVVAMAMGTAFGAANVYAGPVGNPDFANGDTLLHTHMNNIKSAVNDNDSRITTLNTTVGNLGTADTTMQADIANLKGNLANGTCVGNNASDIMVRVGSLCVDKYQVGLYDGTGASASAAAACADTEGKTNCTMVAQSRASGTRATAADVSWGIAARACANAGKRLLTPGEWITAWQNANISDMVAGATPATGTAEWVDAMVTATSPAHPEGGFMGQNNDQGSSVFALEFDTVPYTQTNGGWTHLRFRCAR